MCGIFGYVGNDPAFDYIIKGLKALEYRGYDSYGVALKSSGQHKVVNEYKDKIMCIKEVGNISLENSSAELKSSNHNIGIGHTRWATHGEVNETNSHPHHDKYKNYFVVHNGIIENYEELKDEFKLKDFYSNTDSEIIPKLISYFCKTDNIKFIDSVIKVSRILKGNFAFVAISQKDSQIIAVKMGSPLVIGSLSEKNRTKDTKKDIKDTQFDSNFNNLADGSISSTSQFFMSSDVNSLLSHTKDIYFLDDGDVAVIDKNITFYNFIKGSWYDKKCQTMGFENEGIDIAGFEHFMLKEIYEQPDVFLRTLNRCLPEIGKIVPNISSKKRIILTACGTSWHSGIVGSYWFEQTAKIPTKVEYASEFRYKDPIIEEDTLVIALSQSGETADTIAAIEEAKRKGATVLSICNVKKSTIDRISDFSIITAAGPEIGVASTKAFTTQLEILFLLSYSLNEYHKTNKTSTDNETNDELFNEFNKLPELMNEILSETSEIEKIASVYYDKNNALFLGRGVNYPVALEGALKLKEISYIHAEGYPAAEMKHGPIALIDSDMPSVFICVKDESYKKVISNIREVKARHGKVIAIANHDDAEVAQYADDIIYIPKTNNLLVPFLTVIPLQLLSYYIAKKRGCEIDKPRNLAKSVTVE